MKNVQNDLTQKYSKGTIVIHWLTAILILSLFPLGKYMEGLSVSEKMGLIKIHALLGIIVFLLTLIRSYLFFKSQRPKDLKTGSKFNDQLAIWIHNAFYFLLIAISITGLATLFIGGYIDAIKSGTASSILPKENIQPLVAHGWLAMIMMILLILHVLGVIKHYLFTKENTLKRIS
ncbi:cytochrome b [Aquimarina sp. 2201CG5-10]|uniref:cytochrome b n=1 Tax=Aquimarina callyspongiae TaxID=3098150 RepID=UPI002AB46D8F|nr:cytochrome b/b6 domain-containing protein [Aquimarina sp. 2201CG5-10]MDY8135979.1 cytochrome b/b6 domain-containing protein [Aquimarina sp. 2201CG5-10]